jgi:hypothetical protein
VVSVVEHIATPSRQEAIMAAKKAKRASSKVTASKDVSRKKRGMGVADLTSFRKAASNELTLGPFPRADQSVVDAARRLWFSAQSLVTAPGVTFRKSRREGKVSR